MFSNAFTQVADRFVQIWATCGTFGPVTAHVTAHLTPGLYSISRTRGRAATAWPTLSCCESTSNTTSRFSHTSSCGTFIISSKCFMGHSFVINLNYSLRSEILSLRCWVNLRVWFGYTLGTVHAKQVFEELDEEGVRLESSWFNFYTNWWCAGGFPGHAHCLCPPCLESCM